MDTVTDACINNVSKYTNNKNFYIYSVSQKNPPEVFCHFFPKWLGIFSPNITHLLYVPIYTRLQIFIQSSPTVTKSCHIKCDHPGCISADGEHSEHIM